VHGHYILTEKLSGPALHSYLRYEVEVGRNLLWSHCYSSHSILSTSVFATPATTHGPKYARFDRKFTNEVQLIEESDGYLVYKGHQAVPGLSHHLTALVFPGYWSCSFRYSFPLVHK
jgi:hypothetical protein